MSATTDERWRGNRQGGENSRQNNQQRQSTNPKDRTVQQDRQNNRSPAMPRSKDMQHGGTKTDKSVKGGPAPTLPTDEHIPVNGFNSKEIKAELRKPNATKSLTYRLPKQESTTSRPASTPWGAKPNSMANGKDFFLELRKQISAAQRTGGTKLGG